MGKEIQADVIVVGAGMAGLSAAACLTAKGKRVLLLEQNWIPGGCAASYPRKHVRFEAGATTLVGIEKGMPLGLLRDKTGITFSADELGVPMEIHFQQERISFPRDKNLEDWILRCEGIFGKEGQAEFWRYCYRISELVWEASGRYLHFPPERFSDFLALAQKFHPKFLPLIPLAYKSTYALLKRFGLEKNEIFLKFVNQQLLITAQSKANEANALFGATALCYPLIPNYYVKGGIGKVADAVWQYLDEKGAELRLRTNVEQVIPGADSVEVLTDKGSFHSAAVLFAIPVNALFSLMPDNAPVIRDFRNMDSLWSAFQCSIHAISGDRPKALHHQIHLAESLSGLSSESIFVSFSHPDDGERCALGECVISVSTHVPADQYLDKRQKTILEQEVVKLISDKGWIKGEPLYVHSAVHGAWEKWAGRTGGAVGGYPQLLKIKPWQMNGARTAHKRIYLAGDSCYPGQGIPGAVLGGIIAAEKLLADSVLKD
jgi:phytoene dehydrogenase-like protein